MPVAAKTIKPDVNDVTPDAIPVVPAVRSSDLTKLAREDEAITVQNNEPTIVIFVPEGSSDPLQWGPKGDPFGEDIMELPSTILRSAQFRKQLVRGLLSIVDADEPAVLHAVLAQQQAWQAKNSAREETDHLIAQQQPKAYSGHQCIAQEGRQSCSEFAISSQNSREKPPLCSKHAHLASQYVPEENGQFQDGKPVVQWNRVSTY